MRSSAEALALSSLLCCVLGASALAPRPGLRMAAGGPTSPADRLRGLLAATTAGEAPILSMPCCYDGLTARIIARAGFPLTFMTGFGVSAANGFPDTQLLSYGEMESQARQITAALQTVPGAPPCIGDGDTGGGNALNVKRTVKGYAAAGMAAIMIEDQVAPKRCGHTKGKAVVPREEAFLRIQAACDARDELRNAGLPDILILARTDARESLGMEEAISRCQRFREIGADMTFLEAPRSVEEMREYCAQVDGPKLANMLEQGKTPTLSEAELSEMGYTIAAYPLTLLSASIRAMEASLACLLETGSTQEARLSTFANVQDVVGFTDYYAEEDRYR